MSNTHEILAALTDAVSAFDRVPGLVAEIERLRKLEEDHRDTIDLLRLEIDDLNTKITIRNSRIDDLCDEVTSLKRDRASLQDENAGLAAECDRLSTQLAGEQANGSRLAALVTIKDAEIAALQVQVSDNRSLADKFKSALDKIMGNINEVSPPSAPEVATPATSFLSEEAMLAESFSQPSLDNSLEGNSIPPVAPMGDSNNPVPSVGDASRSAETEVESVTNPAESAPRFITSLDTVDAIDAEIEAVRELAPKYGYWA